VDKNAAYPKAFAELKAEGRLPESCELTSASNISIIWLNKITARIKRLTKPGMGFSSLETAWRTLQGDEIMNGMRKGQLPGREKGDVVGEVTFIARLFGVAA
jgi:transposase, IS6 family